MARKAVSTEEGFEMKLTDTELVLLSAASQREDRAIELLANLKGGVAHKVVAKLLTEGLVEEIRARGSFPVWRRDDAEGAFALRITKRGLKAIQIDDASDAEETGAAGEKHAGRPRNKDANETDQRCTEAQIGGVYTRGCQSFSRRLAECKALFSPHMCCSLFPVPRPPN
jgi:hypothetical protein